MQIKKDSQWLWPRCNFIGVEITVGRCGNKGLSVNFSAQGGGAGRTGGTYASYRQIRRGFSRHIRQSGRYCRLGGAGKGKRGFHSHVGRKEPQIATDTLPEFPRGEDEFLILGKDIFFSWRRAKDRDPNEREEAGRTKKKKKKTSTTQQKNPPELDSFPEGRRFSEKGILCERVKESPSGRGDHPHDSTDYLRRRGVGEENGMSHIEKHPKPPPPKRQKTWGGGRGADREILPLRHL